MSAEKSNNPNELEKDIHPDNDIRNLVMDQNAEHLFEHRKYVGFIITQGLG